MLRSLAFVVVGLLLGIVQSAFAQNESGLGLKAGLNITSLGGNGEQFGSAKVGLHAGVYLLAIVSDKVSLQPELIYSQQGFQTTGAFPYKYRYNYLNLPLIFKIHPNEWANIQLGPQVGYLIKADEAGWQASTGSEEFKKFDFGLCAGLGYESSGGLNFTARYILGFSNITANSPNKTLTVANRVFQLSVGYTFSQ